ncbi:MAG: heme-binding protein [Rudaea sp.]
MAKVHFRTLALVAALAFAGCGGGSNSGSPDGTSPPPPQSTPDSGCTGSCANANSFLTQDDVSKVIAQAANEAQAQGKPALISVVDRVGNVLAVYKMNGAPPTTTITSNRGVVGGLEGLKVPSELAAIAKAISGAYLSSEGNAFTTRTASQIVQEHFNPGSLGTPGGPLFGVQFSQLPCSDLNTHFAVNTGGTGAGPHNSPLGLSADPGGFPLYKNGTPVGGVGVAADGVYGLDLNVRDRDRDVDEMIALAGTYGFGAPTDRRGDRITVVGLVFRYSDVEYSDLASSPASAPPYSSLANGQLIKVPFYADPVILAGTAFGQPASGIEPDSTDYPGLDAFVLTDGHGHNRFPPIAGTDGDNALTAKEVRTIVQQALTVANRARAQIRNPLGSQARVSVSVVDTNGMPLAVARTRDAPIFGTDVSLQKARTASFNSGAYAAGELQSLAPVNYFADAIVGTQVNLTIVGQSNIGDYVTRVRNFLGLPTALGDGAVAFTDRAGGNMARPFYPDGVDGNPNGPFSYPFAQWSPFQDGLQLDLVYNAVAFNLVAYLQAAGLTVNLNGAPLDPVPAPTLCNNSLRLGNGIQVFPGSVPIYRGNTLVGGVGVSGDGVDQDDMVSFLGVHNAGVELGGAIGNAPPAMRADNLAPQGAHLRYVECPQAPFLDSKDDNVCEGK